MNRSRPNPGADRAAQNASTLKTLVKLEGNKVCADCKKNKHPRWASWNLGVFVCIRCSGIHRGMGTHISRVKSVDLDAWTDEQLQSVLKWGNTRANRYWEAKLAPGHVPSEAKIENFIRTKYDTKRWVMDGPMPDPSTLDTEGDDDVPLNIVQEKAKIERSTTQRQSQQSTQATQPIRRAAPAPAPAPAPPAATVDLFGDFTPPPPIRPNTADLPSTKPTQNVTQPAAKVSKPQDSLFGLDFFGTPQGGIGRPSSASSNPTPNTNSRGDLKHSILSLYASAPKPQSAAQPAHDPQPSFGGLTTPSTIKQDAFGGLADAFGGLSFPSTTAAKPPPPAQTTTSPFARLSFPATVPAKTTPATAQVTAPPPLSGGSFFDATPAPKPAAIVLKPTNGLDFSFTQKPAPSSAVKPVSQPITADLFADDGFNAFSSAPPPAAVPAAAPRNLPTQSPPATSDFSSAFNLSSPTMTAQKPVSQPAQPSITAAPTSSMFDPWGSGNDNAWAASAPSPPKPTPPKVELGSVPTHITPNDISGGWGAPMSSSNKSTQQPAVTADEDFGGWTSASATQTPAAGGKARGGFGASDPFDNPWG